MTGMSFWSDTEMAALATACSTAQTHEDRCWAALNACTPGTPEYAKAKTAYDSAHAEAAAHIAEFNRIYGSAAA